MSLRWSRFVSRIAGVTGVLALLTFCLGPLLWQLVTSIKPLPELTRVPPLLPSEPTVDSYRALFAPGRHFGRLLLNSTIVAGTTTLTSLLVGTTAAFAIAKLRFRGRGLLLAGALTVSMFPPIATVSPLYLVIRAVGLRDHVVGLILPYTTFTLPLTVWILTRFFRDLPDELYRAARVDGCTPAGALWHVMLPLAAPGVFTTAILVFIFAWNEFLFALTFTSTEASRTVPVGIAMFSGMHEIPWGELAAASIVVTAPLVALVLVFQKRIVSGLTAGSVKG